MRNLRRPRENLAGTALGAVDPGDRFVLVDIGARGGLEPLWRKVEGQILTVGFEPDERSFSQLRQSSTRRYFPAAVWERSEPLTLYRSRDPGKTSVFRPHMRVLRSYPHPERFETVEEIHLPADRVDTLDRVLADHDLPDVDFVKVDTQGSELPILRGGAEILETAAGLKVEVEFIEMYEGQPLFSDLDSFAREAGFQLVDLKRGYWKREGYTDYPGRGQLVTGDALYVRDQDVFLDRLEGGEPGRAQAKVLKFAAACLVYGVHDHAVTLLGAAHDRGLLDSGTYARTRGAIAAHDRRRRMPSVPWLVHGWRRVERHLDQGHEGWAHNDTYLGNR